MLHQPPLLDFSRSDPNKGMLFDTRDGQTYQVVKIGKQIWLAENFRYLPSKEKGDLFDTSCVYDNDNSYLDKGYGRLYDWNTANHIAPEGWKLPSNKDFQELIDFVIKDNNLSTDEDKVGSYLKSIDGWESCDPCEDIVNNDKYGFNAKASVNFYSSEHFANFVSATGENNSNHNSWNLFHNLGGFYKYNGNFNYSINNGFCVRLIKAY
jgi:uncharacterized protein (TIGR02145 family)